MWCSRNPVKNIAIDGDATITIFDDDGPHQFLLTGGGVVDEGDSVEFMAELTWPSVDTVSANLDGGGRHSGTQTRMWSPSTGTVTFDPGEVVKTIIVATAQDDSDEPTETFNVELSNPVNGILGATTVASGSIVDDDPVPLLIPPDVAWATEGNPIDLVFELSVESAFEVSVDWEDRGDHGDGGRGLCGRRRHAVLRPGRDAEDGEHPDAG